MKKHTTEIWAQLFLSKDDSIAVRDFFIQDFGIARSSIQRKMHITVYHSRRPMPTLKPISEIAEITVPTNETRFMVMAPGGENPRPDLDPSNKKVGIRIHRRSVVLPKILHFRERLLAHETVKVRGNRAPSSKTRNAFGARHFQPHMVFLRAGSGIDRDLTLIGNRFREKFNNLTFDRFAIDVVTFSTRTLDHRRHP